MLAVKQGILIQLLQPYCSKLVWQSCKNTKGTDLDSNGGAIVTPADIDRSSKTVSY